MSPPPRVLTTTHTPTGTATILSDGPAVFTHPQGASSSAFAMLHSTARVPADVTAPPPPTDGTAAPRVPPAGALFCTVEFPPGGGSPLHRTETLDYGVVLEGEVVLLMEDGAERVLRAGDVLVQRGTAHAWANRSDKTARLVFVLVAAEKVELEDGRVLEEGLVAAGGE